MTIRSAFAGATLVFAATVSTVLAQTGQTQRPQPAPKLVSLSSLVAQGFEIKGLTGNQSGVVTTLVLQKDKDVYLCEPKDLSIEPTAFECWPVK